MIADQPRERVGYWGTVERILIVQTVMIMAILQLLLLSEVFTDAGAEFIAAVDAVYGLFGVFFAYLFMTIFGDIVEKMLFWAESDLTETQSEAIRALVWGGASVFLLSKQLRAAEPATGEFAELAMASDVFAVFLALLLAFRAVPTFVWIRLYDALRELINRAIKTEAET